MAIVGLGTDIVQISRFGTINRERPGVAKKVLTPDEFETFAQTAHPQRFLAKRFAAKEAAVKALGTGIGHGVSWQDIWLTHTDKGQPLLQYAGGFAKIALSMGVTGSFISISDEQEYAVATVILEASTAQGSAHGTNI
jgi:holo-[acyl-carrier protein] synthase